MSERVNEWVSYNTYGQVSSVVLGKGVFRVQTWLSYTMMTPTFLTLDNTKSMSYLMSARINQKQLQQAFSFYSGYGG